MFATMPANVNYSQSATRFPKWGRMSNEECLQSRAEWNQAHNSAMSSCQVAFANAEVARSAIADYQLREAENALKACRKLVILNDVRASFNELANEVLLDDECFEWLVEREPSPTFQQMTDDEAFALIVHYWNVQAAGLME